MPSGETLTAASCVHACLTAWVNGHQRARFSFHDLNHHASLLGLPDDFIVSLIGAEAFTKWFPEPPEGKEVVPRQMAHLLWVTLERIKGHMETNQAVRLAAAESFAVIVTNGGEKWANGREKWGNSAAKRRRAVAQPQA